MLIPCLLGHTGTRETDPNFSTELPSKYEFGMLSKSIALELLGIAINKAASSNLAIAQPIFSAPWSSILSTGRKCGGWALFTMPEPTAKD
jgi:hypothetical protein